MNIKIEHTVKTIPRFEMKINLNEKKFTPYFFLSITPRNSFDNPFISNPKKVTNFFARNWQFFELDLFDYYKPSSEKILFNISLPKTILRVTSFMGHPVHQDPTIEARKYSSSKFNGQSFEIFSRNY